MGKDTQYIEDQKFIHLIREMNGYGDIIPITNDPKFGNSVLDTDESGFRMNVSKDAIFDTAPALYYSKSAGPGGDLFFRGSIPTLNNLKWEYRLRDGEGYGCYIYTEGGDKNPIRLTPDKLTVISRILGYYKKWQEDWNKDNKLEYLKKM